MCALEVQEIRGNLILSEGDLKVIGEVFKANNFVVNDIPKLSSRVRVLAIMKIDNLYCTLECHLCRSSRSKKIDYRVILAGSEILPMTMQKTLRESLAQFYFIDDPDKSGRVLITKK